MDGGPWIGKELERKEKSCVECPDYAAEPESRKHEEGNKGPPRGV